MITDPAFLLAVLAWVVVLALVMCLLIAGARDDRLLEQAQQSRQDTQDRAAAESELHRHVGGWRR